MMVMCDVIRREKEKDDDASHGGISRNLSGTVLSSKYDNSASTGPEH